jgi:hypothetical protein
MTQARRGRLITVKLIFTKIEEDDIMENIIMDGITRNQRLKFKNKNNVLNVYLCVMVCVSFVSIVFALFLQV